MTNQKNQPQKNKQGFTIIEVVLVLAIAGLIFLMVFIALPALQCSQRDTQRRNDMARVATALTQYQANNQNQLPTEGGPNTDACYVSTAASKDINQRVDGINPSNLDTTRKWCKFIAGYLNSSQSMTNDFKDPDGSWYGIWSYNPVNESKFNSNLSSYETGLTKSANRYYIRFFAKASCDEEKPKWTGNSNDYAITYVLEGSGVYCVDNK